MIEVSKFEKFIKKPIVLVVGIALFTLSSLITVSDGIRLIWDYANRSVREKQYWYENINKLATETNAKYFESILGSPVYINSYSNGTLNLKEYIFVNNFFYVQAIIDDSDKIIGYSVTTRDPSFNPPVPIARYEANDLFLGKTSFLDIRKEFGNPSWLISYLGAHDLFYSEGYYFGNIEGYQTFYLSMSLAGYINLDDGKYMTPPDYQSHITPSLNSSHDLTEVAEFLETNTNIVNTYTVLSPFISAADVALIRNKNPGIYLFGPDYNQVRLLNK